MGGRWTFWLPALLTATACSPRAVDEGIRVRVLVDPEVVASCLSIELASVDGERLATLRLSREEGVDEYRVAVIRRTFPAEGVFSAAALVGTGCQSPLLPNGRTHDEQQTFTPAFVREVVLHLTAPSTADDADGDGYLASEHGGNDCSDADPLVHPGAQEDCEGGIDRNCDGRLGCADPTCAGQPCSQGPSALAFLSAPQTLPAAACSKAVQVQVQDLAGGPAKVRLDTPLALGANAPGELLFFADPACAQPVTGVLVAARETTAAFFFRGSAPGSALLTASGPKLSSATQAHTLTAPLPTSLTFATAAQTVAAGACSGEARLQARDSLGRPANAQAPVPLTLAATPAGGFSLYAGPGCTNPSSTLTLPAGSDTAGFYFKGTLAAPVVVSVSGLGTASQQQTVTAMAPSQLAFVTPEPEADAGACSEALTVQSRDLYGNPSALAAPMMLHLTAAPDAGFVFYSDSACATAASAVSFGAGYLARSFRFKAAQRGEYLVTAAALDAGFPAVSQQASVHLPWPAGFTRRRPIAVTTYASTPTGGYGAYTLTATFDTAAQVALGTLRADGSDLRVFLWDDGAWRELDREVTGLDTSATTVRFRSTADLAPSATHESHFLYYGAPDAGPAPSNRDNVYLFWDDFESGTLAKWTVKSGAWQAAADKAHSGTGSLKYPSEYASTVKWLVANPAIDQADVLFEAWWYLGSVTSAEVAQLARQQPTANYDWYEAISWVNGTWYQARYVSNAWGGLTTGSGSLTANTWMHVGFALRGTQGRVFRDGSLANPATGTAPLGTSFASGNIGFRKWSLPSAGQDWWVDDVTVRRYTDPEPTTAVGAEEIP